MKNVIIAVIIVLTFFSCKTAKLSVEAGKVSRANLKGQWDWKKTTGGFAGITTTPETARYILHIEFKDNELLFYKNDAITQRYHFSLIKDKTIYSMDSLYIIKPDNAESAIPLVVTKMVKDTIVLADNVNDGFSSTYVKRSN
ncbi:hypothetical protein LT679_03510 [Mucilaginibacter roseus]|uniref:Lipoprotein n=1 Tax=Mucilaginibacter roseus TaxID=1528868 RepID=A0ABS8TXR3_9SPHI|nr:hypothetical protein [Mucilaginibacter roseus]MCD8739660.1 hypothetical protein [Mucilaginibacter roseus]